MSEDILTRDEFYTLYEQTNGFMPSKIQNKPYFPNSCFYSSLKEGCSLLIKNNPELVQISESDCN